MPKRHRQPLLEPQLCPRRLSKKGCTRFRGDLLAIPNDMNSGQQFESGEAARQMIAGTDDSMLVTGANGFIGSWVVRTLLARGFTKIRCLTRSSNGSTNLDRIRAEFGPSSIEVVSGNLL